MYNPPRVHEHALRPDAFERITAADLEPGDYFAETRNGAIYEVESIGTIGASSRWINLSPNGRIRPRHGKKLWRVLPDHRPATVGGMDLDVMLGVEVGELTVVEPEVEEAIVSYHAEEEPVEEGTSIQAPIISGEQVAAEVHEEMLRAVMEGRA